MQSNVSTHMLLMAGRERMKAKWPGFGLTPDPVITLTCWEQEAPRNARNPNAGDLKHMKVQECDVFASVSGLVLGSLFSLYIHIYV